MRPKTPFFSISPVLIRENMRRLWAIPVFGFLAYFFSGVFPILMNYNDLSRIWSHILSSLNNTQPFFLMIHALIPTISAAAIFRYLHAAGSASVMHAMPFTRFTLFYSNLASGLIMISLPVLANGAILLAIQKPVEYDADYSYQISGLYPPSTPNIMSTPHIMNWVGMSLVIVLFVYSLCVLAGIITGNTVMHIMTAGFLNFILPALFLLLTLWGDIFLFGFPPAVQVAGISSLTPLIYVPFSNGSPGWLLITIYLIVSALVCLFSAALYAIRPLERAGDMLVFRPVETAVNYLVTFFGMSVTAYYFYAMDGGTEESKSRFYIGAAAGALIFFILSRMLVKKTLRVWNRKAAAGFGVYAIAALLVIAGFSLDLSGYERRVPNPDRVEEVGFSVAGIVSMSEPFAESHSDGNNLLFKDPGNISAFIAFHKRVVDNISSFKHKERDYADLSVNLSYGGYSFPPDRVWSINYPFIREDKNLKQIFESQEFKSLNSLINLETDGFKSVTLHDWNYSVSLTPYQARELFSCVDRDKTLETWEQFTDLTYPLAIIETDYDATKQDDARRSGVSAYFTTAIPLYYENTVKWLRENGYYEIFVKEASDVVSMTALHIVNGAEAESVNVTDPANMQAVLRYGETAPIIAGDYWSVDVRFGKESAYAGSTANDNRDIEIEADYKEYGGANPAASIQPNVIIYCLNENNPALEAILGKAGNAKQ
ncbi:MAG: hypothetical protein LBT34_03160 [Clostridiales Family XIII bacterium]|nr:hypothetical protein [Clostridiales Family XIII bacterium]